MKSSNAMYIISSVYIQNLAILSLPPPPPHTHTILPSSPDFFLFLYKLFIAYYQNACIHYVCVYVWVFFFF